MKKWIGMLIAAVVLALALLVLYVPGCGWVDWWLYITYGCEAAGGGAGGAG